jgi:hypothetical protein
MSSPQPGVTIEGRIYREDQFVADACLTEDDTKAFPNPSSRATIELVSYAPTAETLPLLEPGTTVIFKDRAGDNESTWRVVERKYGNAYRAGRMK